MRPVTAPAGRTRRRHRYVPPQHGAWAMLVLPYLAGLIDAGFRWPDVPLLFAWLGGYLLSYYALQAVKTRRPARVRRQLILYGAVTAPLALTVVAARPEVLWYAPAYAALIGVNVWYAWRRRERALLNDIASVAQSCLMVFVVATVAGVPPGGVWQPFVVMFLYFTSTVFFVKTMIRERGSAGYRWASVGVHAAAFAVAAVWLGTPLAVVFGWLLFRSLTFPGRPFTAKQIGVIEIVNSVLLLGVLALS